MEDQKYLIQQMEHLGSFVQLVIIVLQGHHLPLFVPLENIGMVLEHPYKLNAKIVPLNTYAHLAS